MPPQELPHTPSQEERPASASFEQRTAAWTGIVYMLCLMFVTCYSIYTGGKTLPGTFPLLLIPVAAASVVIAVYRRCKGAASLPLPLLVAAVGVAAMALGLATGVPALISALTGGN